MTGAQMLDNLGLRLEDPAESVFTNGAKLDALNLAQKTVVNMIDNGYLTELETIIAGTTGADGRITFASLSLDPIRAGITAIYSTTDSKWCTMVQAKDLKRLENTYLAGSATNPISYVFDEKIHILPVATTIIDVWYLKVPTDLADGVVECELNPALQELVLDFAESQLWRMDAKSDRAQLAYTNALNVVKTLNERYQVEKPEGIGTKGR